MRGIMTSLPERVSTLEANRITDSTDIHDMRETLKSIDAKVGRMEIKFAQSLSFIGGMAFTFSLLGGVFVVVAKYLLSKVGVEF